MSTCSVEGCEKVAHSKGLCQAHYRQAARRARGLRKPGPRPNPERSRSRYFERLTCPEGHEYGDSPETDSRGHRICAVCRTERRKTHCPQGHPYSEENTYVDSRGGRHCKTCRRENKREQHPATGVGKGGKNSAKTHCPSGHEYDEENTLCLSGGKKRACRKCNAIKARENNAKKYSLTRDKVTALREAQDNRCAICARSFSDAGSPHIDHDHSCCAGNFSCGKCVRQLLCDNCNQGLGRFMDRPELLRAAADYLDRHASN